MQVTRPPEFPARQRVCARRRLKRPKADPGIGSHWPFESCGHFLREHVTAGSTLDRLLHHCHLVVADGQIYRMCEARTTGRSRPAGT